MTDFDLNQCTSVLGKNQPQYHEQRRIREEVKDTKQQQMKQRESNKFQQTLKDTLGGGYALSSRDDDLQKNQSHFYSNQTKQYPHF